MITIGKGPTSVSARCVTVLGALLAASACGGTEPSSEPRGTAGAGVSQGGTSGAGAAGGSGGPSGAGGTGTSGGSGGAVSAGSGGTTPSGGSAGTTSTMGGAGAGGAPSTSGGTAGTGGSSAGMAGMNAGSRSTGGAGAGGAGAGGAGAGGAGASAGSGPEALSFAVDIWPVFQKIRDPVFVYYGGSTYESCTTTGVCHGGDDPGAGLSMADAGTAYTELLGVASTSNLCDGTVRVVPGQPAQSCLILFYEGRLRDELEWVETTEIDLVREWVAQGALP